MIPSKTTAQAELQLANERNPGPWAAHSENVARAAQIIAALIFAFAVALDHHGVESVFLNMIDVVAWVFMWEAADLFFLQGSALRLKRMRAYHMASAVISFSAVPQTAPYTV